MGWVHSSNMVRLKRSILPLFWSRECAVIPTGARHSEDIDRDDRSAPNTPSTLTAQISRRS
jgi:hypothetical protein